MRVAPRADAAAMMLRRTVAVVALAAAAWAALPAIEWCPFTWLECVESAGATCGSAASGVACEIPCARTSDCNAGASCAIPCDPTPDPLPIGDRAWCVHPALEAIAVRATDAPLPAVLPGLLPAPIEDPAPAVAALAASDRALLPPVLIAPHAPPLSRAPPRA
jgi:hypothetical protein